MILLQSFNSFNMAEVNGPNRAKAFRISTDRGRWNYYLDWKPARIQRTIEHNHKLPEFLIHKTTKDEDGIF